MPKLHILKKPGRTNTSSITRAERKVEEFMDDVQGIASRLSITSRLPKGFMSAWDEAQERTTLELVICFPNLDDIERAKIITLSELGHAVAEFKASYSTLADKRPNDPARVRLAAEVVRAEIRYLKAIQSFQESDTHSKLSTFQQQLLGWFFYTGPLKGFGPSGEGIESYRHSRTNS